MAKGNFLAQFTGEKPEPITWAIEVTSNHTKIFKLTADFKTAMWLASKLRREHPTANIAVVADCATVKGGNNAA